MTQRLRAGGGGCGGRTWGTLSTPGKGSQCDDKGLGGGGAFDDM